jgi:predicted acylesterase/phospholipase RssA
MQAVEVEGEFYWDGSYSGNPAIFPLIYNCDARDILMLQVKAPWLPPPCSAKLTIFRPAADLLAATDPA